MSEHPEILAKSEQHGRITLFQHLKNVAEVAAVMAGHLDLDKQTAIEGAWLHDIGKASPMFQRSLDKDYKRKPGYVFRHEIASIFFVSLIEKSHRNNVIDMVIGHHKSVRNDVGGKGIIDLDDYNEDCFEEHIKGFEEWSKDALDILGALGMSVHPISMDEAIDNYEYVVDFCAKRRIGCSVCIIRKTKRFAIPERAVYFLKTKRTAGVLPHPKNFRPAYAGIHIMQERSPDTIRTPFFSFCRFAPAFRASRYAASLNALYAVTLCALTSLPRKARREPTPVYAYDAS